MTQEMAPTTRTPADTPERTRSTRLWRPLTDIVETAEGILLMVEMPGVSADGVEVTLERRVLTIQGRGNPRQPERLSLAHVEYESGDYERAFTLGDEFAADRIEAQMKNGVLTLKLPRSEAAQPRSIKVNAS
jgi:HSP20 family protein